MTSNIFLKKITNDLINLTDKLNKFIGENKNLEKLVVKWSEFYKMYLNFLYLHTAVHWASVYLLSIKDASTNFSKTFKFLKR